MKKITILLNKTLFLISIMIFSASFAQSDLFVSNGSYVYVDGTAFTSGPAVAPLFVTNDVNLSNTGFIYLRNQAQLLQGNNVGNRGRGNLSVYQTGTSNNYMYNYWASPVGRTNLNNAANRPFRPSNNIYGVTAAPITSAPAMYVSEPNYTGLPGTPPTIASFWLYSFIGTTAPPNEYADWTEIDETIGMLPSGYGFTMKGNSSGAQQYDFRGKPNNGTITATVNANRETLVGNPYPSAIDARAFIHNATNATIINAATLSFWEQDPATSTSHILVNYRGGYATYTINPSGAVVETFTPATFDTYATNGEINTVGSPSLTGKRVFRYIPIGQGFMVEGDASGGTLRFTNGMRTFQKEAATLSEFFRTSEVGTTTDDSEEARYNDQGLCIMPEDYKRFRINLDFNETYTRQLTQTFHHTATAGKDYGLETHSPEALEADAYWPQDDEAYNAQAFEFDLDLRIPLVVNINEEQLLRFRIFDVQNFDEDQPIYIHNINTNTYTDLRQQNYEITLAEDLYDNRFEITFTNEETLNTEDIVISDFNVFQNNIKAELTINNPNNIPVKSVTLYDVTGKQVFNALNLETLSKYKFSTKNLSDGVYVTVIAIKNNDDLTKKVIIKNE